MRISEFDYDLPEGLIAQVPLQDRAASRMLHLDKTTGQIVHRQFRDLVDLLDPGDLLVLNDTRVSARRLTGKKSTGAHVEVLLLRPTGDRRFHALVRPGKRLRVGAQAVLEGDLSITVVDEGDGGVRTVEFDDVPSLSDRLTAAGTVPLPPYIHEQLDEEERYQTVFATNPGSAAAPTAALHFTADVFQSLAKKGVNVAYVTLHVGLDTFRPMAVDDPAEHVMHGEICSVPVETADAIAACTGRVVAVGTTSVRCLESFSVGCRQVESGTQETRAFITPGYEFKTVDGMLTNFHLPRTTMLLMVSALSGVDPLKEAYRQAVEARYRFLSFGDAMLVL